MQFLQFFIFDKGGNEIIEANVVPCSSEQDVQDTCKALVDGYNEDPEKNEYNLLLSCGKKVLFNSKEA